MLRVCFRLSQSAELSVCKKVGDASLSIVVQRRVLASRALFLTDEENAIESCSCGVGNYFRIYLFF